MKTAFYIDNKGFASVDCHDILSGNPGIGGTEYMILLISSMLAARNNGIDVTLYATAEMHLPEWLAVEYCSGLADCLCHVEKNGYGYLVIKHDVEANIYSHILDSNRCLGTKVIVWAHVFMCFWELDYYFANPNISRIINVGRETNELYMDHPAYDKMDYIFNAVTLEGARKIASSHPYEERGNVVTYIGQLAPFKGFHLLAKAWKQIVSEVPDAQLFVIGSGKLYNKNASLGKYGIAASDYEDRFIPYLSDENGKILDSVHFMGVMGEEKREILSHTKVGVPNPSGITETFCISSVEMQIMGARVVTYRAPGFMDTVKNGILGARRSELARNVIRLLKSSDTDYDNAMAYFEHNFSPEAVVARWEDLLFGKKISDTTTYNGGYRLKRLKKCLRAIKRHSSLLRKQIPMTERVLLFIERKIHGPVTYLDSNI